MGFYGNITNTAKTQFQFDRIYPNRYTMDINAKTDGVYIGRYVLVEYDEMFSAESMSSVYIQDNLFYADSSFIIRLPYKSFTKLEHQEDVNINNFENYYIKNGDFHYKANAYNAESVYYEIDDPATETYGIEYGEFVQPRDSTGTLTGKIYKCLGPGLQGFAEFEEINYTNDTNYSRNYDIDIKHYGMRQPEGAFSRAWDSTVWQKVYAAGETRYVCIAELNSTAPGLTFAYDAPTQTPLAPHTANSASNNTYEIHMQPSWGFRVKEAKNSEPSDEKALFITTTYNSLDGTVSESQEEKNASIFYNKSGFNIETSNHSSMNNKLTVTPTGYSGVKYNTHSGYGRTKDSSYQQGKQYFELIDGNYVLHSGYTVGVNIPSIITLYERAPVEMADIQEVSISLPAIGNAVADIYDMAYGSNRARDIEWKYVDDGENLQLGGMTRDLKTIAGTINSYHDAIGMIIKKCDAPLTQSEIDGASSELIYYYPSTNTYYRKKETYNFLPVSYNYVLMNPAVDEYIPNCFFRTNQIIESPINPDSLEKDLGHTTWESGYAYFKRLIYNETYSPVEEEIKDFETDKYYYKQGENYLIEKLNSFLSNRDYYSFNNSSCFKISEDILPQINKEYYEKDDQNNYILLENLDLETEFSNPVYEKDIKSFKKSYLPNHYYYFQSDDSGKIKYLKDLSFPYVTDRLYYETFPEKLEFENEIFYYPSTFFYSENDDGTKELSELLEELVLDTKDLPTLNRHYWQIKLTQQELVYDFQNHRWIIVQQIDIEKTKRINILSPSNYWITTNLDTGELQEEFFDNGYSYYYCPKDSSDESYMLITKEDTNNQTIINYDTNDFYRLPLNQTSFQNEDFYCGRKYYYFNEDGDILLDNSYEETPNREYYFLNKNIETNILEGMTKIIFYKSSEFYYLIGGSWVRADSLIVDPGVIYYNKVQYRIKSDLLNEYSVGAAWNMNIDLVPCTIELGLPEKAYELQELQGFSKTINTVYGLILEMNEMLDKNNILRNNNTLQGVINLCKDLNDKFNPELGVNKILVTDAYGKITTSESLGIQDIKNDNLTLTDTNTNQKYKLQVTDGILGIIPV